MGRRDSVLAIFRRYVAAFPAQRRNVANDVGFRELRDDPEFQDLIRRCLTSEPFIAATMGATVDAGAESRASGTTIPLLSQFRSLARHGGESRRSPPD